MTAWGKTGRVTLEACDCSGYHREQSRHVHVDGAYVGAVSPWGSMWRPWYGEKSYDLPAYSETADAAVAYVLRRTAPDAWREERLDVWRIGRADGGWHVWGPSGTCPCITPGPTSWGDCLTEANRAATS